VDVGRECADEKSRAVKMRDEQETAVEERVAELEAEVEDLE
jgi:hypothetical protein